jgi:hypothetical protein
MDDLAPPTTSERTTVRIPIRSRARFAAEVAAGHANGGTKTLRMAIWIGTEILPSLKAREGPQYFSLESIVCYFF